MSILDLFRRKPPICVDVDLNRLNKDDLIDAAYNLEFIAKELRKMAGEV
jgi:hypothetical protein